MEEKASQISERLLKYGVRIIRLSIELRRTPMGKEIASQLLRSGTSAGANYEEACGAQSRADFLHKLHIVFKEIRESMYWLRLTEKSEILDQNASKYLIEETRQLNNIIAKSIITAKKNKH